MQLSVNTSLQQSQLDFSQFTVNQVASNSSSASLPSSPRDRIELSDEARRPRAREHSVDHLQRAHHERNDNPLADFLNGVIEQLTGAQVKDLQNVPAEGGALATVPQDQQTSTSAQQANLSFEITSLSVNGSINTSDGAKVSFALDLRIMHASASASVFNLNSGPNGYEFNFAGSSAELTSTSFSFSLTSETPDGTLEIGSGQGNFSLKDELKEIRHVLKPLVKEFLHDTGMPSDRRSVNRLLHAIA
ncbi:MAG: hypothetical protein EHM79_18165 [Geobacter sp.]|nr:MAG: hypothetical protein EHM79_18165 [Geobacter sp.]